jgi:hypothetical protein
MDSPRGLGFQKYPPPCSAGNRHQLQEAYSEKLSLAGTQPDEQKLNSATPSSKTSSAHPPIPQYMAKNSHRTTLMSYETPRPHPSRLCQASNPSHSIPLPSPWVMRHGVDVISPSSWEPQEEGMMSIAANFPSVRNQGLSVQEKAKLQKVMLAILVTLQQGRR